LIQGAGKHFSAGADLNWMKEAVTLSHAENVAEAERLTAMFDTLAAMPVPTVAVVRGSSYGGAVGIVACCDVAIATETAKFALSEARVGIIPAVILPYLARKIRGGDLRRLALSGRVFSTAEAKENGLVQVATTTEALPGVLTDELNQLLSAAPEAQGRFKILHRDVEANGRAQGSYTARAIADARTSVSGQAGLKAFLEKSAPAWLAKIPEGTALLPV
jgi:methylglutaconyl-CoA hydratase